MATPPPESPPQSARPRPAARHSNPETASSTPQTPPRYSSQSYSATRSSPPTHPTPATAPAAPLVRRHDRDDEEPNGFEKVIVWLSSVLGSHATGCKQDLLATSSRKEFALGFHRRLSEHFPGLNRFRRNCAHQSKDLVSGRGFIVAVQNSLSNF